MTLHVYYLQEESWLGVLLEFYYITAQTTKKKDYITSLDFF